MTQPPPQPVDIDALQRALDALPAGLEPLDVSALDGFLCGVLLQPAMLPASQWLRFVSDSDGRAVPAGTDTAELHALVLRRHAELDRAIAQRQWFDPWVFELEDEADPSECVAPWVAGFALAAEHFPALLRLDAGALREPLALLYRHLDPDDLEDADDLLPEIEMLEPPADLSEAVEELVRATLLLADVSRPQRSPAPRRAAPSAAAARRPHRGPRR